MGQFLPDQWQINTLDHDLQLNVVIFQEDFLRVNGFPFQAAIIKLDQQVCEAVKRLNALRHQKNSHEKKLQALQTEYNQLVTEAEEVSNTDAGESAEAQVRRIHWCNISP